MPSRVGGQAAARLNRLAVEIEQAGRKAVSKGALDAKNALLASLDNAASGRRLRNVGKSGAKLGVRYDVKGTSNPTALVRATGPWHLIENPSKPHTITPRKRGGFKAIGTPFGPRRSVQHPGVRTPKRPWKRGLPNAEAKTRKAVRDAYLDAAKRGMR